MATMHVHELIAQTAKSMAGAGYDELAQNNEWYAQAKASGLTRGHFINSIWPQLIEPAKATLVQMLAGGYPEALKEEIERALILNHSLRRGKTDRDVARARSR